jgi:hypothetical protein
VKIFQQKGQKNEKEQMGYARAKVRGIYPAQKTLRDSLTGKMKNAVC